MEISADTKVVLVGRNALTKANKKVMARTLREFVLAGGTVVVLEQELPLEKRDLPIEGIEVAGPGKRRVRMEEFRQSGGRSGAVCFPVAPAHPVMQGLAKADFFTWAGDETNFRLSYATPSAGAVAIVQGGDGLGLTPLMELPVGQGSYLLSQMCVAEKLDAEPVAEVLLHNLLTWASARGSAEPGQTLVFTADDHELGAFIARTGLLFESVDRVVDVLEADVAVVKATPTALDWLAQHKEAVTEFCEDGNWLMLVGLDERGLGAFNTLVSFKHRLRSFRAEAVKLDNLADPLLMGLSDRDAKMYGNDMIAAWQRKYWISKRVFTAVVDGPEIASFASFASGAPANVTNGLTNEDFWRYIHYVDSNGDSLTFKFDRPETIAAIRIKPTAEPYYFLKDIEIVFDSDKANPVRFACQRVGGLQDVPMSPRQASTLALNLLNHWPGESARDKELMGVDIVEIFRQMPGDDTARVVTLTQPGGLVKYPIGAGGIVLNQLDHTEADIPKGVPKKQIAQQEANIAKKLSIYSNLLRNMGAAFRTVAQDAGKRRR